MVLPRQKKKEFTLGSALASMGNTLVQTAYSPNIYRYNPHPKQELFHRSTKHGRLFIGGNRTGKTVSNVVECIWWLTKTHPYRAMPKEPVRGRFVTVDFKNIIKPVTIPMFKQWLPQEYLINGDWDQSYDKETDTLHLNNGSFIEFMSYEQETDKFASASRHFVAFDEEPPQDIFEECGARLIDTDGSWWMSMTPLFGMTWVYTNIYEPANNNPVHQFFVVQADMADNPHLPAGARDAYLATLSEDDRKSREKGEFVQLGGKVFKNYKTSIHVLPWKDFQLTHDMRIYTSVDSGWVHPTAWLWHAVKPDGTVVTFFEMRDSFVTIEQWAERVHAYESTLKYADTGQKANVYLRTGDPALRQTRPNTGISDIGEYARHRIYLAVEGVPAGPDSVDTGLKKFDTYLQINPNTGKPSWMHTENCTLLQDEMLKYHWETWATKKLEQKNASKTKPHKKHDDLCDSLRYFISIQPDLSYDTTVPTKEASDRLGAVTDIPMPMISKPEYTRKNDYENFASLESSSIWSVSKESDWEMEW